MHRASWVIEGRYGSGANQVALAFTTRSGEGTYMLHTIAIAVAAGYGALSLAGGVMGYVRANSRASLIAGGVSGLLLLGGAVLAVSQPALGLGLAALVSAALVARFARSALSKRNSVAYVMVGGGVAVLVAAGMALV
jgi:uncharacterized membrane protein (UPF0136 family)